jgi:hypothetical protein
MGWIVVVRRVGWTVTRHQGRHNLKCKQSAATHLSLSNSQCPTDTPHTRHSSENERIERVNADPFTLNLSISKEEIRFRCASL